MSLPPTVPKPGRQTRVFPLLAASLSLLPVILVFGWYAGCRLSNTRAVHRLEAQIRQHGEPLTSSDLAAAYPPVPPDQNVAVPLLELWQREDPRFWKAFREGGSPMPERMKRKVDPALPFLGSNSKRVGR